MFSTFRSAFQLGHRAVSALLTGAFDFINPPQRVSANFNGTTQSLLVPSTGTRGAFIFTGDFTIEGWYYTTSVTGTHYLFTLGTEAANRYNLFLNGAAINSNLFGSSSVVYTTTGSALSINTWYHIALVRSGSTITLYVNGVADATTDTQSGTIGNGVLRIGADGSGANRHVGNISNVRTASTAVYTGNFTPPTKPLSLVAYTNLGGSAAFNGSQLQALTIPANAAFATGTNNFTIEYWLNQYYRGPYDSPFGYTSAAHSFYWPIGTSQNFPYMSGTGTWSITGGTLPPLNTWNHYALVRNGTTMSYYLNGVLVGTTTANFNLDTPTSPIIIGAQANANNTNVLFGNITNFRWVNGLAVYTSAFTPPTAPLTAISATATSIAGGSISFTTRGTTSVATYATLSPAITFGTSNWTIEAFVYFNDTGVQNIIGTSTTPGMMFYFQAGTGCSVQNSYGQAISWSYNYALNTWYHVAASYDGTYVNVWVNGNQLATGRLSWANGSFGNGDQVASNSWSGASAYGSNMLITNLRVVVGSTVYATSSTTITVPTAQLTAIANTQLLMQVNASGTAFTDTAGITTVTNVGGRATYSSTPYSYGAYSTALLLKHTNSGGLLTDSSANNFTVTNNLAVAYSSSTPLPSVQQFLAPLGVTAFTDISPNTYTITNTGTVTTTALSPFSANWVDSVSGIVATVSTISGQPTYDPNYGGGIQSTETVKPYVDVPTTKTGSSGYTISMLANVPNASAGHYVPMFTGNNLAVGSGGRSGNYIYARKWTNFETGSFASPNTSIDLNFTTGALTNPPAWYDFVYNGTSVTVYRNGQLITNFTMTAAAGWSNPLRFAGDESQSSGNSMATGTLYRMKHQTTALDATAISAQFETVRTLTGGGTLAGSLSFPGGVAGTRMLDLSVGFTLGAGSYTVEGWFQLPDFANQYALFGANASAGDGSGMMNLIVSSSTVIFSDKNGGGGSFTYTVPTMSANTWYHFALTRNGTTEALFINGVRCGATQTNALNYTAATTRIGMSYVRSWPGLMTNMRVVVGSYVYDPAFSFCTVPIGPLTFITNTKYLMTGADPRHDATNVNNVTNTGSVTTSASKPF
jgi:hypothetical protein